MNLSDVETDILIYLHAIENADLTYKHFITDLIKSAPDRFPAFLAMALGRERELNEISQAIGPMGKLVTYGLIQYYNPSNYEEEVVPKIEIDITQILSEPVFDEAKITEQLVGKPAVAELTIKENFYHINKKAQKIITILKNAKKKNLKGINIVIYGPAGSGKTELAKAIVHEAGYTAYAIGEDEDSNTMGYGDSVKMNSMKRLSRLRRAQAFFDNEDDVVNIMDEMEDLLVKGEDTNKAADTGSKILLNRTLEENEVPTIWIANDIDKFHSSVRQRFKIIAPIGYQPTTVRQDIWRYHLKENALSLSDEEILNLARKYEAPPRVIAHACEVASLSESDQSYAALCEQVEDQAALECGGHRIGYSTNCSVPDNYDLNLVETDLNIKDIVQKFKQSSKEESSSCFLIEGARKVGKSSFAHYLAEESTRHALSFDMGTLVRPTNQSDPVDHISMVFNEAAKADAILVIENCELLFNFAAEDDREKMIERFMEHLDTHKAPVVLISNDGEIIPNDFKSLLSQSIKLDKIKGKKLSKAVKKFLGHDISKDMPPTAIGVLSRVSRSSHLNDYPANDDKQIQERIAASASLFGATRTGPKF